MLDGLGFQTRTHCPACKGTGITDLWSGQFNDEGVARNIDLYHYSADWRSALGSAGFALVECRDCRLKYHRQVIDDASLYIVYGKWADAAQARRFEAAHVADKADRWAYHSKLAKLVLRLRHLIGRETDAPRLLDFGCGDGALLRMAHGFGFETTGIDVSATRSGGAMSEGYSIHPDFEALDAAGGGPFDAIVLSQVLEHVVDPLGLLCSLNARLASEGVLFVAVPDTSGVEVPRNFHEFTLVQPIEHINAFTPDSLRDLARRAGFAPVRRPSAFVTTSARDVLRAAANWIYQPKTTDVFFKRAEP
ncbi:class I SAM-dependent methyltransferase [Roseovarius sp. A21]|uniref:Class I SAM-dependent methyltransferase n=1 Tax=Roseovarius bejariae TaxID=2576383 RepID=A0A844CVH6_9RHOB|nr:class I SAM-dependent methyltransferase [Roseovarius bejariae]MRU14114.1 class I SAM-dependent methyltransferase [Roseovarius bejariae]